MARYEVTGEILKSAIAGAIRKEFAIETGDPPVTIYPVITKEKTLQGTTKPSFFIWQLNVGQEQVNKDTIERTYHMNVRYFPEQSTTLYEELDSIGNRLLGVLRSVDVPMIVSKQPDNLYSLAPRPVKGTDVEYKIEEDVLQVFANYTIRARIQKTPGPLMEDLTLNESVKQE